MKERFALLMAYFKDKLAFGKKSGKEKRKSVLLSIVALVEVLAIAIVSVSAWVETISTVKFEVKDGTIDNYVFTNAKIGYGDGYDGNSIDLTKYFRNAGGAHLASATSANGRDIYFPTITADGTPSGTYRKATVNDKNVNYVDFSFNVTAEKTSASFYFDKIPTIKVGDTSVSENKVRVSFLCDGNNAVVCAMNDSSESVVSGTSLSTKEQENAKSFATYTGSTAKNPLFTVPMDSTKKVTMRVWLQDDSRETAYAGQTVSIDNFKLVTQNQQTKEFTFSDKTTGDSSRGAGWATQDDRAIWINQSGKSEYKKLTKDSSGNYSIELGVSYTDNPNATFTFYSCESTVKSDPQKSYVAKWTTTLKDAADSGSHVFTAYGFRDSSNNGYGTWGEVQKILLTSEDSATLPMEQVDGKYLAVNMFMKGNSNPIAMTFIPNESESLQGWVAYMPDPDSESSHSLTFSFTNNGKNYSIGAPNRGSSVNFVVTSATTGYWAPPAIVSVYSPCKDEKDDNAEMGTVSVTGGMEGATRVKVTSGTTVALTATAKSNKYRFTGWYTDPEFQNLATLTQDPVTKENTIIATSTTKEYKFYAKFERQYTVEATAVTGTSSPSNIGGTVQMDGGGKKSYVSGSFLEGESTALTANVNEGYDFIGWYSDKDCQNLVSKRNSIVVNGIEANHSYYAKFMIKQFSVTAVASHPDDKKSSTVKFSSPLSEASNTSVSVSVDYNGSATFVANPAEGYEFVGWYSDKDCTTLVSDKNPYTQKNIKSELTLYAKFKIIDIDVNLYAVTEGEISGTGGTVKFGSDAAAAKVETTVPWGTVATLTATAAHNYKFGGWYTNAACTVAADETILNNCLYTSNVVETTAIKKTLTLYAKFIDVTPRKVTANAVFNGNIVDTAGTVQAGSSAAGATSTTEVVNGEGTSLIAKTNSDKYKFMGWYSDKACTNPVGQNEQLALTDVRADCNYYALFKLTSFTITAAVESGSVGTVKFTSPQETGSSATSVSVTVEYDGSATFVATPAEGYDFDGWYKADGTLVDESKNETYIQKNITSDFTLYARFKLKEFDVKTSAVLNGAVSSTGGTVQVGDSAASSSVSTKAKWGSTVTLTATAKDGYSFSGWYTDLACTKPYTDSYMDNPLTAVIKANTTVYAKFEQKRVIYLQIPDAWKTYNNGANTASFAVYMWTSNTNNTWFGMTKVEDNIYKVDISGSWTTCTNIIFTKMKTGTSSDWDNKIAQTVDETIPSDSNCFTITGNYSDSTKATGTWKKYPPDTFTVVLDAVTYDTAGVKETNGFTGGKISFGGSQYTSALTKTYSESTTITATAVCNNGYEFKGWYTDSDCITKVADNAQLSISASASVHYYAKFVKGTQKTIYFVPNSNWTLNKNERFAAYVYEKSTGYDKWFDLTYDESKGCYSFTYDSSNKYDKIIFSRMNGSTTENNWNNEWNRTPGSHGGVASGLDIPTDGKNCFNQGTENGGWDNCGGTWSTK